jgi:heme-degrading monooxygenase HmoA
VAGYLENDHFYSIHDDYAKWKPVFDADSVNRQANGSRGGQLFRNASDPNELVILFDWEDLEKTRQFAQSEDL